MANERCDYQGNAVLCARKAAESSDDETRTAWLMLSETWAAMMAPSVRRGGKAKRKPARSTDNVVRAM